MGLTCALLAESVDTPHAGDSPAEVCAADDNLTCRAKLVDTRALLQEVAARHKAALLLNFA
jgi:hypothetical protein